MKEEQRGDGGSSTRPNTVVLVVLVALLVGWVLMMRRFEVGNVYSEMGLFSCGTLAVLLYFRRSAIASDLSPRLDAIGVGLGVGVVTTVLTYPAFELAAMAIPGLPPQVELLYERAQQAPLAQELAWIFVIIVAEELLFRGVLLDALEPVMSIRAGAVVAVVVYALAQLGSGSVVVACMAVVMGGIWTAQRLLTRSLLSPLVAHLIWTPTVILLHPVVGV